MHVQPSGVFSWEKTPPRLPMQITWPWPSVSRFCHGLITIRQRKMTCQLFWIIFAKKTPHSSFFKIGAHIGICAQISRNTLLYLPSLKDESPILLLMLISAWLTVSRAFNSDEKRLLNYSCLIIINHCISHIKWLISK